MTTSVNVFAVATTPDHEPRRAEIGDQLKLVEMSGAQSREDPKLVEAQEKKPQRNRRGQAEHRDHDESPNSAVHVGVAHDKLVIPVGPKVRMRRHLVDPPVVCRALTMVEEASRKEEEGPPPTEFLARFTDSSELGVRRKRYRPIEDAQVNPSSMTCAAVKCSPRRL